MILRLIADRPEQPAAAVLDARTVQGSVGKRSTLGLRRAQEKKRSQGPSGGGHAWASAGRTRFQRPTRTNVPHVDQLLANVQEATGGERGGGLAWIRAATAKRRQPWPQNMA